MTHYLCSIIEMYDGRQFVYDEFILETDQEPDKILEIKVRNITDDEDGWDWNGEWWSNYGESAYTIGNVRELPNSHVGVLSDYFRVEKV